MIGIGIGISPGLNGAGGGVALPDLLLINGAGDNLLLSVAGGVDQLRIR